MSTVELIKMLLGGKTILEKMQKLILYRISQNFTLNSPPKDHINSFFAGYTKNQASTMDNFNHFQDRYPANSHGCLFPFTVSFT